MGKQSKEVKDKVNTLIKLSEMFKSAIKKLGEALEIMSKNTDNLHKRVLRLEMMAGLIPMPELKKEDEQEATQASKEVADADADHESEGLPAPVKK
jgi:hypothetical protein